MRAHWWRLSFLAGASVILLVGGCGRKESSRGGLLELTPEKELGVRIGSVAAVPTPEDVRVEGFGLVGGLAGTGSSHCPPGVREYLKRYIASQLPGGGYDADELIDSKNTAVVRLEAAIPAAASRDDHFDVQVSLLPGSDALSLHGGRLYKAELKPAGTLGAATRASGTVEGMVFINMIGVSQPDLRTGLILGGGRVGYEYQVGATLRTADFLLASRIRNRLNDRYGPGTSEALSAKVIGIRIPAEYRQRKPWFLAMVGATHLDQTPELTEARTNFYVRQLAVSDRKEQSEIALEAMGRQCLAKLAVLLKSSDEEVRLRAARCMLNLGDDRGFGVLREIALDEKSSRRMEALEAIVLGGERNDAIVLAERLLDDRSLVVMLGAYERLRRLGGTSIDQEQTAGEFYVEQVAQTDQKAVYVTRSGDPRIVLFGASLTCRNNLFVESPDKMVVINAQPGQESVSVMRRHPTRSGMIGPLQTSFDLADIVRTLGGDPAPRRDGAPVGLGVSYSDVAVLVEQLVAKGGVQAEFWAGPLPKLSLIIKK